MPKQYRDLYDDALNYTDGFVMEVNMKFPVPSGSYNAEMRALCVDNIGLSSLKSCFSIVWRNDQTEGDYYFLRYINSTSWLFNDTIDNTLLNSPVLPDMWEPYDGFPSLFGNWIVR